MMNDKLAVMTLIDDADLVTASLSGDRDAFRHIVERHQTVLCSLAYNATGSISQSEDLAQETFLTAWKSLRELREPAKIRSWLCGILRNHLRRNYRDSRREPLHGAALLDEMHDRPADEALPSDHAISRDEEAILWRSLERIPETYREPLILYYRQHQSVETVAAELDLTEDAVKQRLNRGRKLLQEEVQQFVESTLQRTAPGPAFSSAVCSALPMSMASMSAAGVGGKSAAAKLGFWGVVILPFIGVFACVIGQCMVVSDVTTNRSLRLRKQLILVLSWIVLIGAAWGGEASVEALGGHFGWNRSGRFAAHAIYWTLYLMALIPLMSVFKLVVFRRDTAEANATLFTMKPPTLAASTFGFQLAMFWPLFRQAWVAGDWDGLVVMAAIATTIAGTVYHHGKDKSGAELGKVLEKGYGFNFVALLLTLNFRVDVWAAASLGVTVSQAREQLPLWLVPTLTAILIGWTAIIVTKRQPCAAAPHPS